MTKKKQVKLELQALDKQIHNRNDFDCGVEELNTYLKMQAGKATERNIAKTFVLVDPGEPEEILGYYTFLFAEVKVPKSFPYREKSRRQLSNYPHNIPAVKLGRLAVSIKHKRNKLGEALLIDAIIKTAQVNLSNSPPITGIFVDAKHGSEGFYKNYGFHPVNEGEGQYLWLPAGTCDALYRNHIDDSEG